MAYRDKVVDVVVSLGTAAISTDTFETPLFVTPTNLFTERVRSYTSLTAMVEDGFAVGSAPYKFVENCFAGKFAPESVKIGRLAYTGTTITFGNTSYSGAVSVNLTVQSAGVTYTKVITTATLNNATGTATATAFATAVTSDVSIGSLITATATTNSVALVPDAGVLLSVGYAEEGKYIVKNDTSESVAIGLPLISSEDDEWYYLSTEAHDDTSVLAAAAYASSAVPKRMHVYSSADPDIASAVSTTDIASLLKAQAYDTSIGFYSETADSDWSEGGIIGASAAIDPSYGESLHLKTMPSIVVSNLSATARNQIWEKNCNYYRKVKGVNVIWEGKCASGQYFDTIRFSHWLATKVDESLFSYLYNRSNKGQSLKMSDQDLPVLKSVLTNDPLQKAIRNGAVLNGYGADGVTDYSPVITIPTRSEIPATDLAARFLDDIVLEVVYAGSLHFVKVRAYVNLNPGE